MRDKLLYIAVIVLIACAVGVYIGTKITKEKIRSVTVERDVNIDSIKAVILPKVFDSVATSIKPIVRWRTRIITDTIKQRELEIRYDSIIAPLGEVVVQSETYEKEYWLWQQYDLSQKQFSHRLHFKKQLDTLLIRTCETTFWEDVYQYGKYTLIGVIAFFLGKNL